ncbi:MAG: hypothetical protein BIFFINMI_00703 [Phycisphaerae bacterium]|nr:hypothetical protein [Phycisphaerae bacterium]
MPVSVPMACHPEWIWLVPPRAVAYHARMNAPRTPAGPRQATALPRIFDRETVAHPAGVDGKYRRVVGEFWTARQKQMTPLHYVISYRASFKPELPAYFIERLTDPGQVVYDPFLGRGTTALAANLMGRTALGSDVNPLSIRVTQAKCRPATLEAVEARLATLDLDRDCDLDAEPLADLTPFYHRRTIRQLVNLRTHLARPDADATDRFIELLALSRLHGHSDGFFSVYSFPQISVPPSAQRRINRQRRQRPTYRPIAPRIVRKARRSLAGLDLAGLADAARADRFFVADAGGVTPADLPDASVDLIVTSPPFLAKANYLMDNWLEFWFAGIDPAAIGLDRSLVQTPSLERWRAFVGRSMAQMVRVLRPGGHAVIEVGEVEHEGTILHLDEVIVELAAGIGGQSPRAGKEMGRSSSHSSLSTHHSAPSTRFRVVEVLIHAQKFTKLANCFNVSNNRLGTNTHRLVILRRA